MGISFLHVNFSQIEGVRRRQERRINDFLAAFSIPASLFPDNLWTMEAFSIQKTAPSKDQRNHAMQFTLISQFWGKILICLQLSNHPMQFTWAPSSHHYHYISFLAKNLELPPCSFSFPIMEESCQLRTIISLSAPKQELSLPKTADYIFLLTFSPKSLQNVFLLTMWIKIDLFSVVGNSIYQIWNLRYPLEIDGGFVALGSYSAQTGTGRKKILS